MPWPQPHTSGDTQPKLHQSEPFARTIELRKREREGEGERGRRRRKGEREGRGEGGEEKGKGGGREREICLCLSDQTMIFVKSRTMVSNILTDRRKDAKDAGLWSKRKIKRQKEKTEKSPNGTCIPIPVHF